MHASRKGFTLIELMISLVLLTIVGGGVLTLLNNQQRATRQQAQLAMLQSNVRTGTLLLPSELRELHIDATGGDIVSMAADNITYRAMRGTSVACAVSTTQVTLRNGLTFGYRAPIAGRDSLLLFIDNDTESATDDGWKATALAAPAATTCPDGSAATAYTVAIPADTVAMVSLDAVVRTFEVMQLTLYQANGRNWLGARSVSANELAVQPVLGPLTATGVQFRYLTADGVTTTTNRSLVRSIDVRIVGETDGLVSNGSSTQLMKQDSLTARIRLRNAPRL
jgi:prepilin-type N-terminal cleavage/methylation domain-containing protein